MMQRGVTVLGGGVAVLGGVLRGCRSHVASNITRSRSGWRCLSTLKPRGDLDIYLRAPCPKVTVEEALAAAFRLSQTAGEGENDGAAAVAGEMCILDVRTAEEYAKGHIRGSRSVPLFDGSERAVIGTMYHREGKQQAIEHGKSLVSPRLDALTASLQELKGVPVVVTCARGGMRSHSLTTWLSEQGFDARQLVGGYKRYRTVCLETINGFDAPCIVLAGATGVGKTLLLQCLEAKSSGSTLDLEGCAQHRASVFGGYKKSPRTQQNFESELHHRLLELNLSPPTSPPTSTPPPSTTAAPTTAASPSPSSSPAQRPFVFIEAEASRIGKVMLSPSVTRAIKGGTRVLCEASTPTRVARLIREYPLEEHDTEGREEMRQVVSHPALKKVMGGQAVSQLHAHLSNHDLGPFVETLLIQYYDPVYSHGKEDIIEYAMTLDTEDLDTAADRLLDLREKLMASRDQRDQPPPSS